MPKDKKDLPKKQAKRGNLPLPVDVIEELRDWKRAYEIAWSDSAPDGKQYTMTYEQLIRRLLEGVKRLDPEVWATHEAVRKSREEQEGMMADFRRSFWSELKSTKAKLDGFYDEMMREIAAEGDSPAPTREEVKEGMPVPETAASVDPTEGEVWNMRYFFERDGEEIEAYRGYWPGFFAEVDGEERDQKEMMADGWVLMNEAGIEISPAQAIQISIEIRSREAFEKTAYGQNLFPKEEGENIQEGPSGAAGDSPAPADDQVQSPEPVATPEVPADPTEGEVWKKGYYFEKDGVRQEAFLGTKGAAFYAVLDGEEIGFGSMMYRRYKFYNSDGIELTKRQAEKISARIKANNAKS